MDILDYLEKENIKINAVPGAHILPLYEAVRKKGEYSNLISWRTEYGSGFGALGNIQATGNPAIVISTAGPGITNMVTHVAQANVEFLPLIAIGVNNYFWDLDQRKGLIHELPDSRPLFRDITYDCLRIESAEEFTDYLTLCIYKMRNGQSRPVYIEVPSNIISELFEYNFNNVDYKINFKKSADNYASEVLRGIDKSKFPVILIGWGAQLANTGDLISKLAQRLGAIIITTVKGRGTIPDTFPLNAGCIWDRARPFDTLAQKSDFVLALGTSLSLLNTRDGKLPINGELYHVITEGSMLKKMYPNSKILNCDIKEFLTILLSKVDINRQNNRLEEMVNLCKDIKVQWREGFRKTVPIISKLVDDIRESFDDETQFSFDMCQEAYWLKRYLQIEKPYSIHMPTNFGTLGCAVPSAIGAAAVSSRNVVCITGDGGFSYGLSEISTALKYNIPIKIILFNNNSFDSIIEPHKRIYNSTSEHYQLINPDYKKLAESFGIDYYFANNNTIKDILVAANSKSTSYIIEAQINGMPMFNEVKWPEWTL